MLTFGLPFTIFIDGVFPISFALCSRLVTYAPSPKEEITTYLFWDCPKLD
jgi:hypothetical protein